MIGLGKYHKDSYYICAVAHRYTLKLSRFGGVLNFIANNVKFISLLCV